MVLSTIGAEPEEKKKGLLSESTRLLSQEVSPDKDKAMMIADKALNALESHHRTKKLLMFELRGEPDTMAFGVDENRARAEKNVQKILAGVSRLAQKEGVSFEKAKEALLMNLEIDELQQQMAQDSYEVFNTHDKAALGRAVVQKNIDALVTELNYHSELRNEVLGILNQVLDYGVGVKGITRMKKSTEARQLALKIYQAGMAEDLLNQQ